MSRAVRPRRCSATARPRSVERRSPLRRGLGSTGPPDETGVAREWCGARYLSRGRPESDTVLLLTEGTLSSSLRARYALSSPVALVFPSEDQSQISINLSRFLFTHCYSTEGKNLTLRKRTVEQSPIISIIYIISHLSPTHSYASGVSLHWEECPSNNLSMLGGL